MTTRTIRRTITFLQPFYLKGVDRLLPPRDYDVVTDEELIEGTRPSAGCLPRQPRQRRKAKAVSDRKALAREIAARTKPRFTQIKPEGRAYKATRFIEIPRVRPGGPRSAPSKKKSTRRHVEL